MFNPGGGTVPTLFTTQPQQNPAVFSSGGTTTNVATPAPFQFGNPVAPSNIPLFTNLVNTNGIPNTPGPSFFTQPLLQQGTTGLNSQPFAPQQPLTFTNQNPFLNIPNGPMNQPGAPVVPVNAQELRNLANVMTQYELKKLWDEQINQALLQYIQINCQPLQPNPLVTLAPVTLPNGVSVQIPVVASQSPPSEPSQRGRASRLAMEHGATSPPVQFTPHSKVYIDKLKSSASVKPFVDDWGRRPFRGGDGTTLWERQSQVLSTPSDSMLLVPTKKNGLTCLVDSYDNRPYYLRPTLLASQNRNMSPYVRNRNPHTFDSKKRTLAWRDAYHNYLSGGVPTVKYRLEDELYDKRPLPLPLQTEANLRWKKLDESSGLVSKWNLAPKNVLYTSPPPPKLERVKFFDPYDFTPRQKFGSFVRGGPPLISHLDDNDNSLYERIQSNYKTTEVIGNLPNRLKLYSTDSKCSQRKTGVRNMKNKYSNAMLRTLYKGYEKTSPVYLSSSNRRPTCTEKSAMESTSSQTIKSDLTHPKSKQLSKDLRQFTQLSYRPGLRGGTKIRQKFDSGDNDVTLSESDSQDFSNICNKPLNPRHDQNIPDSRNEVVTVENEMEGTARVFRYEVKLKRLGYYSIPDVNSLKKWFNPRTGECLVKDFEIGHRKHGKVVFDGWTNVAGLDFDETIRFDHKVIEIYPKSEEKPNYGIGLHKPCTVTLTNVWPIEHTDLSGKTMIKDLKRIQTMGFEDMLRKACRRFQGTFISYTPQSGEWKFRVQEVRPLPEGNAGGMDLPKK